VVHVGIIRYLCTHGADILISNDILMTGNRIRSTWDGVLG
jgi:hypothetical protein